MSLFSTRVDAQSYVRGSPLLSTVREMVRANPVDEAEFVTRQLIALLDGYYVHLPLKRSSLGIDPVQDARILLDEARFVPTDVEFYTRIFAILKRLRDRHTAIRLPSPWRDMVAYLPFAVESFFDAAGRHLIVSKLMADVGDPEFALGVEITHWNGVAIRRHVERLGWDTEGANPFARIAIALRSLTARPLGYMPQPDEDWAALTYRTESGRVRTVVIPWRIYFPAFQSAVGQANVVASAGQTVVQGLDRNTLLVNSTWYDLYAGLGAEPPGRSLLPTRFGDVLRASKIETERGEWAYLRIFSFDVPDPAAFVLEIARLLGELPQAGVIIDLRGNPGGSIPAGESLMCLFTGKNVQAEPVSFRNTPEVRRLGALAPFRAWQRSLEIQNETGEAFTQGFPLTEKGTTPRGVYPGRVVLIIDALCYSTTDFFAAGMQDNGLATILGVDPVTGAGGANVWSHSVLNAFVAQTRARDLTPMPGNLDIDISMRRSTRVGPSAGVPLEGLGVFAEHAYALSRRDVLGDNRDLIAHAASLLERRPT